MSNAAQVTPSRFARIGAAAGVWYGWVTVEMTMAPSWAALIPAASSAWSRRGLGHVDDGLLGGGVAAADDAGPLADPLVARSRCAPTSSELGTTRSGR